MAVMTGLPSLHQWLAPTASLQMELHPLIKISPKLIMILVHLLCTPSSNKSFGIQLSNVHALLQPRPKHGSLAENLLILTKSDGVYCLFMLLVSSGHP